MERQLIRENPHANLGVTSQGKQKTRLFNEALKLANDFIEVPKDDYKTFGDNFRTYILKEFRERTKDFASHFSESKLLEFFDFPDHVLRTIESRWSELRFVEMSDDYQSVILRDLNPYAETPEELERLKVVRQLIEALETITNNGHHIDFHSVARATNSVLIVTGPKSAEPNENYIKSRRF
jgi:hypothetical protein